MSPVTTTEVWRYDARARAAGVVDVAPYATMAQGVEAFWSALLTDGLDDAGAFTAVDLELWIPGRPAFGVPRDEITRAALGGLRSRRRELRWPARLAAQHVAMLDAPFAWAPLLGLPVELEPMVQRSVTHVAAVFGLPCDLTATGTGDWRTPAVDGRFIEVSTWGHLGGGYDGGLTPWQVLAHGCLASGAPCGIELEDVDLAGWSRQVVCPDAAVAARIAAAMQAGR